MKTVRYALWGMVVIFTAILGFFYWQSMQAVQKGGVQIGTQFNLAAARGGGKIDSSMLVGKPYGVFFGFTHCPEVCPTTLMEMTSAYDTLGKEADDFRLFFITVDPERDTAEYLSNYLESFDTRIEGLVPTATELADVAGGFRAIYEKVPTSDGSYTMNHTASIYLFDRSGKFSGTISYAENAEMRLGKIRRLLQH